MTAKQFSPGDIAIGIAGIVAAWGVSRLLDVDVGVITLPVVLVLATVAVVRGKPEGVRTLVASVVVAFALTAILAIGIVVLGAP